MWKTVVAPNETPALLSARAGVPVCAILRANRLFSPAWLLPGREIDMPDDCASSDFPCPVLAARVPAQAHRFFYGSAREIARASGLPLRAVLAHANERAPWDAPRPLTLPEIDACWRLRTILPGEAPALTLSERAVNALWGAAYPGMKMLFYTGD